jgi:ribosomal protein S18 acetylase RimI-like enzyme
LPLQCRLAESSDAAAFSTVAHGVFDKPVDPDLLAEFLDDPRHHIAIADEDGSVVGFVSAVDYVHPDKPRQLFINEVGVAPSHRGRGIAKRLLEMMISHAKSLGCSEAWVLTDAGNVAANALYQSAGAEDAQPQLMYAYPLG